MKFNTDHWDKWLDQSFVDEGFTLVPYEMIINYLRNGQRFRAWDGYRILQCVERPSFFPWVSYEVFEDQDSYYLLRVECKLTDPRPIKMRKKRRLGVHPVFSYSHLEINVHTVTQWLENFRISAPILTEGPIGGDGARYELCLESGFQSVRYMWWSEASDEWAELDKRFKNVVTQMSILFEDD